MTCLVLTAFSLVTTKVQRFLQRNLGGNHLIIDHLHAYRMLQLALAYSFFARRVGCISVGKLSRMAMHMGYVRSGLGSLAAQCTSLVL